MLSSSRFDGLRAAFAKIGLPAWFIAIDLLWVAKPDVLGVDARHYQRAATAWLAGENPWAVTEAGIPYGAGPHTLLFYAPTAWLPIGVSTTLWLVIGIAASVWLVRRLGLPLWWMLFPPLAHAMWNGNPQTVMLALLVAGTAVAGALAAMVKLYAVLPLAFHPRRLAFAILVLAVTLPLLPWQAYLDGGFSVGLRLTTAWNGSAWRVPLLLPPTLLALWLLRRRGGEWFAIPAVFPATQFYYVSTALPALVDRRAIAALLALPVPLLTPFVVIGLAIAPWAKQQFERSDRRLPEARAEVCHAGLATTMVPIVTTFPRTHGRGLSGSRRVYCPCHGGREIGGKDVVDLRGALGVGIRS